MTRLIASTSALRQVYRIRPEVVAISLPLVAAAAIHNVLMLHAGSEGAAGDPLWCTAIAEASSGLVILALVPLVDRLVGRFPFRRRDWRRPLAVHLAAIVPFSIAHVVGMIVLREAAFGLAGTGYDFGSPANWLAEELPKDAVAYALIVAVITGLNRLVAGTRRPDQIPAPTQPATFAVSGHGRTVLVRADAVRRVEASGNYVTLHTGEGAHLHRSTLRQVSERLPDGCFLQVHRSHLIRPTDVAAVNRLRSGDWLLAMQDGTVVPMSRRFARAGALSRLRPSA